MEEAEDAVWAELDLLRQEVVDERELEKVKNKFESAHIFGNINYLNVATNLAWFELTGCAEDINLEVPNYRAVSVERLHEVSRRAFQRENGTVLQYRRQTIQ